MSRMNANFFVKNWLLGKINWNVSQTNEEIAHNFKYA